MISIFTRRFGLYFVAGTLSGIFASPPAIRAAGSSAATDKPADRLKAAGQPIQESDSVAPPLAPIGPRSESTERSLDAMSWYMTGRVHEIRNERKKALEAYRKAIELDPLAAEVYRSLVPLAFDEGQVEEAVRYATRAIELLPDDHELLHRLGVYFASQRKLPEAIRYLKQAADSPQLEKDSPTYVLLMRELGILYSLTGQAKPAAEAYAIVFMALQHPEKFHLDLRTKSRLLADPQTSYEKIGQVLLDGERVDLAADAFELAAKSGRASAGNLAFYQARVLLLSDKPEEALNELQKYLDAQRQSKGRDAYVLLSEILEKLNRGDELIGRLEQLAEKDTRNSALQYFLAEQLSAAGELDQAREIYEAALQGTGDAAGYLGLAGILRKMNRPDELLDALGRALAKVGPDGLEAIETELNVIAADPELLESLIKAGRAQRDAEPTRINFEKSYLLAKVADRGKRVDDAAEFFRIALDLDQDRKPVLYTELGSLYYRNLRYADAAKVYEQAASDRTLADRKVNFLFLLSNARAMAGDTDAALAAVRDAQQAFERQAGARSPELQFQEGWIYFHAKKFDQAVDIFEKVMADYPEQKELFRRCQFSLSNIHVQRGDTRKGEEILERILAEDPDDPSVNNDLGYLYADQGKNLAQAEKMIRKAVEAEPNNAAYQDSLGWVLFKLGKYEEARAPLEKAVANSTGSGDATLWDHLGDLYHRLELTDKAVEAWQKALDHAEKQGETEAGLKERLRDKLKQHKRSE
jgi:tetratricopeptide (TPR) repeat protein